MSGASVNEQDPLLELLASEQKAAVAAGQAALASLCEALVRAVRNPPAQLTSLEGAKAALPPGTRIPASVDRALAHLKARAQAKPAAPRASGSQPAAGAPRASGSQPAAGAPRASGSQPAAGAPRASGLQPAQAPSAIAPRPQVKPAAAQDPMAWLNKLIEQLKAFLDGLMKKPPPAPAAPVRRRPEPKLPPPMPPEEKAFFDALSEAEQATYRALSHAQRELVRQPQGRERLSTTREPAADGTGPVTSGDLAGQLTTELFATLGEGPDAPSTRGALRGVALQTVANLLRETQGNVPAVKTRGLLGLLDQTEFSGLLLAHVERELVALPPSTRKGAQSYHEAFKRLRPELVAHARKLVYPGLTSTELIGALVDAVVESVDQQPRTGSRRGAGARGKKVAFQGRYIRG